MDNIKQSRNDKWFILILSSLTNAIVFAVQSMSLSVLLPEISNELNLSLVQAGLVWGISSLPGIFINMIAGVVIDRWESRKVLMISCLLAGLFGASRSLAQSYGFLLIFVFLFGCVSPFILISNIKNIETWFHGKDYGIANGTLSLGMALGFFIGSMISASFISPWLGGWRNVFILYGAIALSFAFLWYFIYSKMKNLKSDHNRAIKDSGKIPFVRELKRVAGVKNMWLLGLSIMAINGGMQGFVGYFPLYLGGLGWDQVQVAGIMAAFHLASMIFILPITFFSGRVGNQRKILIFSVATTTLCLGLIAFVNNGWLWALVILTGFTRDAIMAMIITMTLKVRGIQNTYAGVRTGFILFFAGLGHLLSPPIGNKFVIFGTNAPFIFWASLCLICLICMILLHDDWKAKNNDELAVSSRAEYP